MIRWLFLAVLVVALSAVATVLVQFMPGPVSDQDRIVQNIVNSTEGPPGRAVIAEGGSLTHDFGTMSQHSKGEWEWVLKNEGAGPLKITKGTSSCSCTILSLKEGETATLAPGASTPVKLEWNTKDHTGKFAQRAQILTPNDQDRQMFEFVVTGTVSPALVTIPPGTVIPFENISNEESHKGHFALFAPDKPDLEITSLRTSRPEFFVATYVPLSEREMEELEVKSGYQVFIELKPGLPLGDFHEELEVKTNHPKKPVLKMAITGRAVGPISVVPSEVFLSRVSTLRGGTAVINLWVRGQDHTSFSVLSAPKQVQAQISEVDDPSLKSDPEAKARRYRMMVTIPPGTAPGKITGAIILKTDHPHAAEVKVPVNVTVQAAS